MTLWLVRRKVCNWFFLFFFLLFCFERFGFSGIGNSTASREHVFLLIQKYYAHLNQIVCDEEKALVLKICAVAEEERAARMGVNAVLAMGAEDAGIGDLTTEMERCIKMRENFGARIKELEEFNVVVMEMLDMDCNVTLNGLLSHEELRDSYDMVLQCLEIVEADFVGEDIF